LLTVALEDYYHVGAFNQLIQRGQWYRFERRLDRNTAATLDLLDEFGLKATFFVLGWVAEHAPEVVRGVAERGHEIASRGYYHRSIWGMTPEEFRDDLARAREVIEHASGRRVRGHRVADQWFRPCDLWALDLLAAEGYAYDSSIAPIGRAYAAEPWRRFAHTHAHADRAIWEFPIPTAEFFGFDVPIGGGNWFRQLPRRAVWNEVARWDARVPAPFVLYFHTWELDPDQPKIAAAPLLQRIRQYRNLERMPAILRGYFERYPFTSIAAHLGLDPAAPPEDAASAALGAAALGARAPDARTHDARAHGTASNGTASNGRRAPRPTPSPGRARPSWTPEADEPAPRADDDDAREGVTIVVPCYNEELILPYLANTLESVRARLGRRYALQFLFVDDRSTDGTWPALQRTFGDRPDCTLVRHERNRGVAAAILTGIRAAHTEVVCSIDCDCTYDPHELERMIPRLAPGVAMVTASPYHPQGHVRNVPEWRLFLSRGLSAIYRHLLHHKLYTYTSCFRVYRRSALLGLRVERSGFLGVAETLGRLDLAGARIVEHPATLEVRMLGRSKMKILRTIVGHLGLVAELARLRLTGGVPPIPPSPAPQPNDVHAGV
ncbi:MAG TPA: glycosyltransferase, partial [Gemmatimonadales bacterium]|nr:glycosyltransferase [Gemmatimonadales bacterium]